MSRNLAIPKAEARIAVLQSCIDHIDSLIDDPILHVQCLIIQHQLARQIDRLSKNLKWDKLSAKAWQGE